MTRNRGSTSRRAPGYTAGIRGGWFLVVVAGRDVGAKLALDDQPRTVGSDPGSDLVLDDTAVSRRHLSARLCPDGAQLRDLGSTNGTYCGGARFETISAGPGTTIVLGETELRLMPAALDASVHDAAGVDRFGRLATRHPAMRALLAMARAAASSHATILVQGETGSGKDLVAEAVHQASPRRARPFVICDLAALAPSLASSELFGHVRGAFTGAERDRRGAFAEANGGTIFLDEIGELGPELQPLLLRVLETGQLKPVGKATHERVDVRIIAATNRDLRAEVKEGRFRKDLFHRLAVVTLELPPLRERKPDIPLLAAEILADMARAVGRPPPALGAAALEMLSAHDWPGNVRELRNVLDRAWSLRPDAGVLDATLLTLPEGDQPALPAALGTIREGKGKVVGAWERQYVEALLAQAGGNVSLAARRAGMGRVSLYRLLKKHGLGS